MLFDFRPPDARSRGIGPQFGRASVPTMPQRVRFCRVGARAGNLLLHEGNLILALWFYSQSPGCIPLALCHPEIEDPAFRAPQPPGWACHFSRLSGGGLVFGVTRAEMRLVLAAQ
jgi:hypothetical protein